MHTSAEEMTMTQPIRTADELLEVFERANDLPTLPEVAVKLISMLNDSKSSATDAAKLIADDPAISVKVLKMVNSSLYAPANSREITSLPLAISRLGFVAVANIALSTSVFKAFNPSTKPAFDRKQFWHHSVSVGLLASLMHNHMSDLSKKRFPKDVVHLAGIVHDMGKILFERYANVEFHLAIHKSNSMNQSLLIQEKRVMGMGHDEAGGWLSEKWNLGREITNVIRWHHDPLGCPDEEDKELVMLVHMADYIAHKLRLGESGNEICNYDPVIRDILNISPNLIDELREEIKESIKQSLLLLSLTN